MGIEVHLDESKPVFRITARGLLSLDHFLEALPKIQGHEGYRPEIPLLWDLLEADLPQDEVDSNTKLWNLSSTGLELAINRGVSVKAALVVTNPRVRQAVEVYIEVTEGDELEPAMFCSIEAAETWLFG